MLDAPRNLGVSNYLQRRGILYTFRHNGFFKSMDTHKDQQELEQIYEQGKIPWLQPATA